MIRQHHLITLLLLYLIMPTPVFYIRDIPIYGDVILSPMAGYSDLPYRWLCRQMGSAMSYTEFITDKEVLEPSAVWSHQKHTYRKQSFLAEERPVALQLLGSDGEYLLAAALHLQELGADVIDLNAGCPVRGVVGRGAGAGLLRTPVKLARIVRCLSRTLRVPLTVKIRLGWDDSWRNFRLIARIVEENGGAMIVVHGRTRQQGYSGAVDLDAIAEVVQAVNIPVIGNGGIQTPDDIEQMKTHTGCTAVMVGRGAIGNPWIFARRHRQDVPRHEVLQVMLTHLESMLDFYGESGLMLFRKHADRYLASCDLTQEARLTLLTCEQIEVFRKLLEEILL